jgi:hypothetical protein
VTIRQYQEQSIGHSSNSARFQIKIPGSAQATRARQRTSQHGKFHRKRPNQVPASETTRRAQPPARHEASKPKRSRNHQRGKEIGTHIGDAKTPSQNAHQREDGTTTAGQNQSATGHTGNVISQQQITRCTSAKTKHEHASCPLHRRAMVGVAEQKNERRRERDDHQITFESPRTKVEPLPG